MIHKLWFYIILIEIYKSSTGNAFNLPERPCSVLRDPQWKTPTEKTRSSYFGYTILLRENSVIIGAPRAQSTTWPSSTAKNAEETGEIYKCHIWHRNCTPLSIVGGVNVKTKFDINENIIKDNQWLGASMDGDSNDADKLVVCAPRFGGAYKMNLKIEVQYMQGMCYLSTAISVKRTQNQEANSRPINPVIERIKKQRVSYNRYHMAEAGFSLHMISNYKELIIGVPGLNNWEGGYLRYNIETGTGDVRMLGNSLYGYAGYAVASGYLNSPSNDLILVITIPHANLGVGETYLLDKKDRRRVLHGTQYGEFFGYAALVEDVNGDGLDDVLISAPQYHSEACVDNGAVYVFLNEGHLNFRRMTLVSALPTNGRFGTTITKLGDINLDGYKDIAIGAPFAYETGAVAIHLGGPNGLTNPPSQILRGSKDGSMFGHGLSKGLDIDHNGFNDLAVGAPNDERVFIYRAYPVVQIISTLKPNKRKLEVKVGERFEIEACYRLKTNSTKIKEYNITLKLSLDTQLKRADFYGPTSLTIDVRAKFNVQCKTFEVMTNSIANVIKPIQMTMEYKISYPNLKSSEICGDYPIVDPSYPSHISNHISFMHDCDTTICHVDLKVSLLQAPSNITLGMTKVLRIRYGVENTGQMSFDTQLVVMATTQLPFSMVPVMCNAKSTHVQTLTCDLAKDRAFEGNATVDISFDLSTQIDEEEILFTTQILSRSGNETYPQDNVVVYSIQLLQNSIINIEGKPKANYIAVERTNKTVKFNYDLKIYNDGPSALGRHHLYVQLPVGFKASAHDDPIYFINITNLILNVIVDDSSGHQYRAFQLLNTNSSTGQLQTTVNFKKISSAEHGRQLILACNNKEHVICTQTHINLPHVIAGHHEQLEFVYEIDVAIVEDIMQTSYDYLGIMIDVLLKSEIAVEGYQHTSKLLETIFLVDIKPEKWPLWVYILSSVGGFLVLVVMTYSLSRAGFFKRQTKEEMEKLLYEKVGKARMSADLNRYSNMDDTQDNR